MSSCFVSIGNVVWTRLQLARTCLPVKFGFLRVLKTTFQNGFLSLITKIFYQILAECQALILLRVDHFFDYRFSPCIASIVCVPAINKASAYDFHLHFRINITETEFPVIAGGCDFIEKLFPFIYIFHLEKGYQNHRNLQALFSLFLTFFIWVRKWLSTNDLRPGRPGAGALSLW